MAGAQPDSAAMPAEGNQSENPTAVGVPGNPAGPQDGTSLPHLEPVCSDGGSQVLGLDAPSLSLYSGDRVRCPGPGLLLGGIVPLQEKAHEASTSTTRTLK